MAKGMVYIFSGEGRGKSAVTIGRAVQAATEGKRTVIIQFLKQRGLEDSEFLRRMEPEIKLFRFEKSGEDFEKLPEGKKQEEIGNIKNGINFARKVLATGECDLLILDEVLGVVEKEIVESKELMSILSSREDTDIILTGVNLPEDIRTLADEVSRIETAKYGV